MDDFSDIELCEPEPFMYFENGQVAVTDGVSVWLVIVTKEALRATAAPSEPSLKRLIRFSNYYRELAEAAIARGEDQDGKVWIFERDVLASPPQAISRRKLPNVAEHVR